MVKLNNSDTAEGSKFFDTHCHLHEEVFEESLPQIIEKMKRQGVDKFMTIGTSVDDSERALRLRDKYPEMCLVACALDPTMTQKYIGNIDKAEADFKKIAKLAEQNDISAIGETGLDKNWRESTSSSEKFSKSTLEVQHLLFELHIDLASGLGLPLVIHQREAIHAVIKTLKEKEFIGSKEEKAGIFHSFTGDRKDLDRILELGFYVGINGIATFKNASKLQGAIQSLPIDSLLFETDAPFLTPEPFRGIQNDPSYIPIIAEFIEGLKNEQLSKQVYKNSSELLT